MWLHEATGLPVVPRTVLVISDPQWQMSCPSHIVVVHQWLPLCLPVNRVPFGFHRWWWNISQCCIICHPLKVTHCCCYGKWYTQCPQSRHITKVVHVSTSTIIYRYTYILSITRWTASFFICGNCQFVEEKIILVLRSSGSWRLK